MDEIHTIVGAGSTSGGSMDASNLLKPYLSDGSIRFIGSTTYDEYKKYFEKDKALLRRFQKIEVPETSVEETLGILQGLKENYERFHGVVYTDKALEAAVELAKTLGYVLPKVGIVSAVEKVNPKIESTMDAKKIVEYYQDKEIDFLIDGPFAVDNLVSMESVEHKGIKSEVAGVCDILLFPNLDGGNIFYKTSVFLANGKSAGIIMGAKVPIVLTSRADTAEAKLNSILLAVVNKNGLSSTSN